MKQRNHGNKMKRKEGIAGILFILPAIVFFLVFFLLPLCICIYAGFTNWNILSVKRTVVGLRNFQKLFADPKFIIAIKNTFYMLIPIPIYLTLGLGFAYSCHKKILGEKIFRVIYYLPYISSVVALVLIWKWLFNSQYGIVNNFLAVFGVKGPDWLGDPVWTRRMIVAMISWKMIGIVSIYFIAALESVPKTYYEAAQIDGAGRLKQFLNISLPMLTPTIFYLTVVGLIGSLQTFVEVQLFTTDGGRNYGVGTVIYYIWQKAFDSSQMGYACAAASVFGLFILIITAFQMLVSGKWVYRGE